MAKPITEPPEWRRRARRAPSPPTPLPPRWGRGRMADAVPVGLAALEAEGGADSVVGMKAAAGFWADADGPAPVAVLLEEMADSVEARVGVDPPVEPEGDGGGEGG